MGIERGGTVGHTRGHDHGRGMIVMTKTSVGNMTVTTGLAHAIARAVGTRRIVMNGGVGGTGMNAAAVVPTVTAGVAVITTDGVVIGTTRVVAHAPIPRLWSQAAVLRRRHQDVKSLC